MWLTRLSANPHIYNWIQKMAGLEEMGRRLQPYLRSMSQGSILDAGGGTGQYARFFTDSSLYLILDVDGEKLAYARERWPGRTPLAASIASIPLPDRSIDNAICVAVTHHLDDDELERGVHELARVVRRRILLVDAVERPDSALSTLLWRYDQGSFPRPIDSLRSELARRFRPEHVESFSIYHNYLLFYGSPRVE